MAHVRTALSLLHRLAFAAFAPLLLVATMQGQMPASSSTTSTPVPGVGHNYLGDLSETVNPSTGSLSIRLNAMMPSGRQLTLPFSFAYDSNSVGYVSLGTAGNLQWMGTPNTIVSGFGWSESAPIVTANELTWTAYPDLGKPVPCFGFVNYVYQDPRGNHHNLNLTIYNDVSQSGPCTSDTTHWPVVFDGQIVTQAGEGNWTPVQGAIIASIPDTATGSPVTVSEPDGTIAYFSQPANQFVNGAMATSVEDRNGGHGLDMCALASLFRLCLSGCFLHFLFV